MVDEQTKKKAQKKARCVAFSRRLTAALIMNEKENQDLASVLGVNGPQLITNWRNRDGRVGRAYIPIVRDFLKKTNFDWLQEGVGEPERLIGIAEPSPNYDVRQSYSTRIPPAILAQAVRVMEAEEHINGKNPPLKHANLLLHYCDRIAAGESVADLIAELTEG